MGNKRYSKDEIAMIVKLKNAGKTFAEISSSIFEKFGNKRSERVLKIIYDRHKNDEAILSMLSATPENNV